MGPIDLALPKSQAGRALRICAAALVVLAAVWTFQAFGVEPCELCLTERWAWYAAVPLALIAALAASRADGLARVVFAVLVLIFLANAAFAFYHVGVEERWWPGPTACTGSLTGPLNTGDLLNSLNSVRVVSCDVVQMRILGLSFAGWDVIASLAMALYAALAARRGPAAGGR